MTLFAYLLDGVDFVVWKGERLVKMAEMAFKVTRLYVTLFVFKGFPIVN